MSLLFMVQSCHRDRNRGDHQLIRHGWAKYTANIVFFIGGEKPTDLASDEIWVDAPDDYAHLSHKTRAAYKWALEHGFECVYKTDTDTTVYPIAVYKYLGYDFVGNFHGMPGTQVVATKAGSDKEELIYIYPGGDYLVSKKALELLVKAEPTDWAEDWWAGQVLGPHIHRGLEALNVDDMCTHHNWRRGQCRTCLKPVSGNRQLCEEHV
jgi:hypothetical protein